METIELKKKTNKQVIEFLNLLMLCTPKTETRLEEARKQTIKNAREFVDEHKRQFDVIRRDFCLTDPSRGNAIMKDERGDYMFSKDGDEKCKAALRKFAAMPCVKTFDIIQTFDTAGLSHGQIEELTEFGFLLSEKDYKARYEKVKPTNKRK